MSFSRKGQNSPPPAPPTGNPRIVFEVIDDARLKVTSYWPAEFDRSVYGLMQLKILAGEYDEQMAESNEAFGRASGDIETGQALARAIRIKAQELKGVGRGVPVVRPRDAMRANSRQFSMG